MQFKKLPVNPRLAWGNRAVDGVLNRAIRSYDGLKGTLGLSGRRAKYDDKNYEFEGGAGRGAARQALRQEHAPAVEG